MKQSPIDYTALLRQAGMRATPGRIALLTELSKEPHPLTVQQLESRLQGQLNHVTLYRALEALTKAAIVTRVDLGHDHAHYELLTGRSHHHHAVCTECGLVEDIEVPHTPSPERVAATRTTKFAEINRYSLEFFGVCRACTT